jgi:hypothetical protein
MQQFCFAVTDTMEQSPSWEANSPSASQEIPRLFFATQRFITVFTRARHQSLSWAKWIQSAPSNTTHTRLLHYVFILSTGVYFGERTLNKPRQKLFHLKIIGVWEMSVLWKETKFIFYKVITVFTLLYGNETLVKKNNSVINIQAENSKQNMTVFWNVVPCSLVDAYRRFRGACCLPLSGPDYTPQHPRRR